MDYRSPARPQRRLFFAITVDSIIESMRQNKPHFPSAAN
jgi:hypothetical protein